MRVERDRKDAVFFPDVTVISTVLHEVATLHKVFHISRLPDVLSQDGVL